MVDKLCIDCFHPISKETIRLTNGFEWEVYMHQSNGIGSTSCMIDNCECVTPRPLGEDCFGSPYPKKEGE